MIKPNYFTFFPIKLQQKTLCETRFQKRSEVSLYTVMFIYSSFENQMLCLLCDSTGTDEILLFDVLMFDAAGFLVLVSPRLCGLGPRHNE